MSEFLFVLAQLDGFCAQLAAAIHGSQAELYAMLTLVAVAAFFAFPPRDDSDQV